MTNTSKPAKVLSFADFKKAANEPVEKIPAQPVAQNQFVAFDVIEQKKIMGLHRDFSAASRDYDHKYEDGRAFIALLACCHTREELVRITKMPNKEKSEQFLYSAYGSVVDGIEDVSLDDALDHARTGLAKRVEEKLHENRSDARRAEFKLK